MCRSLRTNNFIPQKLLFNFFLHNDISLKIDNGKVTVLMLFDLSTAFNTNDHNILIRRLSTDILIRRLSTEQVFFILD